jgi:hypothetical protein
MAAAVYDTRLKSLLLELTYQWHELAATARSLEADAKAIDDFSGQRENCR